MCDKKTVEEIQGKNVGIKIRVFVDKNNYIDCDSKSIKGLTFEVIDND